MRTWIASGFLAAVIFCIPALAQDKAVQPTPSDPVKVALGRDIYDLTQNNQSIAQRAQALAATVAGSVPETAKAKENIDTGMKIIGQTLQDMQPKIREAWAFAAAERFSLNELHAIKDFYSSPTGSKLIAEQPLISQEILKTIMPEMLARLIQSLPAPAPQNKDAP